MISKLLEKWLLRRRSALTRRFHRILDIFYHDPLSKAQALLGEGMDFLELTEFREGNVIDFVQIIPDDDEPGYHIEIYRKIEVESDL